MTRECARYTHKRGDSFALAGAVEYLIDGGAVQDMTGWTASATLRTRQYEVVAQLQVDLQPSPPLIRITAADTAEWPLGVLLFDITFTDASGFVRSTPAVEVYVQEQL